MKFKALLLAMALPTAAMAQPAEVWQFHEKMGGGDLYLQFCLAGTYPCVERKAIAFGQVCDSSLAEIMGNRESGDIDGIVPPGFSYTGFRCGANAKFHPKTDKVFGGGNWMN